MSLYLCIDGGGTKTRAWVAFVPQSSHANNPDDDPRPGRPNSRVSVSPVIAAGEAGSASMTFGVAQCISSTALAVSAALTSLSGAHPSLHGDLAAAGGLTFPLGAGRGFVSVWGGYAGCARPPERAVLEGPLRELLAAEGQDPASVPLRLTSDAELATAPMYNPRWRGVNNCVSLICGTGSSAVLWGRETYREESSHHGQHPVVVEDEQHIDLSGLTVLGRSGGWGPLLSDHGSGWSLGKHAVVSVLDFAANHQQAYPYNGSENNYQDQEPASAEANTTAAEAADVTHAPPAWHAAILEHFGVTHPNDLIGAAYCLDPTQSPAEADSARRKLIAGCARIVIRAAQGGDTGASKLLDVLATEIVDVLRPLVEKLGLVPVRDTESSGKNDCILSVTGGLAQLPIVWGRVERRMLTAGWRWTDVIFVPDPGLSGLETLVSARVPTAEA